MGGKKKLTLKQMARMQARQRVKKGSESKGTVGSAAKGSLGIFPPDPKSKKVMDELRKIKVLTPYRVASRLDLRLSVAKHFLRELERRGAIEYVSGSKNLKIYKFPD